MKQVSNNQSGQEQRFVPFGEHLGELVRILNLADKFVSGSAAEHLSEPGTVYNYFHGKRVSAQKEKEILRSLANALVCSNLIPGLKDCLPVKTVQIVDRMNLVITNQSPDEALAKGLNRLAREWHKMEEQARYLPADFPGVEPDPEPVQSMPIVNAANLLMEIAYRYAALICLGYLEQPGDEFPSWLLKKESQTPLRVLADKAGMRRQDILQATGRDEGCNNAIDRMFYGSPQHIPLDGTLVEVSDAISQRLTKRGIKVLREDILMAFRRYYACRAVVQRVVKHGASWEDMEYYWNLLRKFLTGCLQDCSALKGDAVLVKARLRYIVLLGPLAADVTVRRFRVQKGNKVSYRYVLRPEPFDLWKKVSEG